MWIPCLGEVTECRDELAPWIRVMSKFADGIVEAPLDEVESCEFDLIRRWGVIGSCPVEKRCDGIAELLLRCLKFG